MKTLHLILFLLLIYAFAACADIIYDVDFEAPVHTVDTPITVNANNDTPSGTLGGTVIARTGLADMSTQVASLEPAGNMSFTADQDLITDISLLSWDLAFISTTTPGFSSVSIQLGADGGPAIQVLYRQFNVIEVDGTSVGPFTAGQSDHFQFSFNLDANFYDLAINGSPVLTSEPIGDTWALRTVSFGHPSLSSPNYAVDNFQWTVIPEPSTLALLFAGVFGLAVRRALHAKARGIG